MKTLKMYPTSINDHFMDEVVETLRDGGIIIYPTDTLYAIGCDALNNGAVERICKLKGINPAKEFLSVICADISMASDYARIDNEAFRILRTNLPGPFTFILPSSTKLPKVFKGRKTVGVRIPGNAIATEISRRLGGPVLTTSIKWDEDIPEDGCEPMAIATRYENDIDLMVDGGTGDIIPSTIVNILDSSSPEITREGKGELE